MADTAFQIQYRQEFIAGFEQHKSLLSQCVTNEAVVKGNQATFLTVDSGGATAVTRGVNGLIPARANNNTQTTVTLVEWHDLPRQTGFNLFASQGDQRRAHQMTSLGVINRKIDSDIITTLDSGGSTYRTGATAQTGNLALVMRGLAILGNNAVPIGTNIFGLITPAFYAYLMQTEEFENVDYINRKPFDSPDFFSDEPTMFRWAGVNWIVHPNLTGAGTSSEKCYLFHRSAVGHAVDRNGMQALVGYNEEQDYYWTRTSMFMGTAVLQTKGVVQIIHDGSAYVSA